MKLARETFTDIKDPYATVLAEAGQAAKLLADRGLAADIEPSADGARPAGNPQVLAAGVFGSAQEALAEWQHAAGPPPPGRRCRQPHPS